MEESFPVHDGGEFRHECVIERNGSLKDKCQVKFKKTKDEMYEERVSRTDHDVCLEIQS